MKKWSILLGICLAIQIVLVIGANLARTDYSTFKPMEKLLSFDPGLVDDILVKQDDQQQVVLTKQEGQWRVARLNNFQADQDKVEDFLKKLSELKKGWPVTTTSAAARRFKVTENNFERKIILSKAGQDIDTLYIGTSPSFRKVHARSKDQDAVYAVSFNTYEAGANPEDWIDKGVLKHPAAEISSVQLADCSLSRREGRLIVEGIDEETQETNAKEADRLINRIANLRIRDVLGTAAKPQYRQDRPVFSYTLTLSSGDSETYAFSKPEDANYYVLKPSNRKEYFKVDDWVVDAIQKIDRSKLIKKKE